MTRERCAFRIRAVALAVAWGSVGCVSVPVGPPPSDDCERRGHPARADAGDYCTRNSLTIGFFPTIGESHQNGLATNGRTLTARWRLADYTLRPLAISGINVLSLGLPTGTALALEIYEEYSMKAGPCARAVLGYCKGVRLIRQPPRSLAERSARR